MIHLKFVNVHVLFPVWCYGIKPTLNNTFIEFYNIITREKQEIKEIKVLEYRRQKCGLEAVEKCFSLGSVPFFPSTTRKAYTKPHWAGSCFKDKKSLESRCSKQKKMLFMMLVRIIKVTNGFLPVNHSLINVFFFLLPISWNKGTVKILVINATYFQPHISFPRIVS